MAAPRTIAFVSPRYPEGATVGGAETLLRRLAERLAARGAEVAFLATCARDHFTWANEWPADTRRINHVEVRRFPVDTNRDHALFLARQAAICRGETLSPAAQEEWLRHSVQSAALIEWLQTEGRRFERIVAGPYLFGLVNSVARGFADRTLLVPCLHDEPFARQPMIAEMMRAVRGCLFNSEPERALAGRLYGAEVARRGAVVGLGLDPFEADPHAFAARHHLSAPYVFYCGRREAGKGTPLLTDYLAVFRERTGRDVRLVCAGSGPLDLQPFVHDVGFLSEAEKHEAMAGAVAFIHPSTMESLGIVLLESFLAGTPALVHAGGEVLRWQCERSGGGLWFRHYPDFETELQWLLDHPELRAALGRQAQAYVRREYAWETVERRLIHALEAL
ncbi:glycosyltransferase family 4 protein [Thermosphaera sp.]